MSDRNAELAKIHIAKKQQCPDDATYRAVLVKVTGCNSAGKLDAAGRRKLLDYFRDQGFKAKPGSAGSDTGGGKKKTVQGKVRALWLSLYHLGVVHNPSDEAVAAFVKKQMKIDRPEWMSGRESDRVIEALKAMAARDAGVDWSAYDNRDGTAIGPRRCVIDAQWQRLKDLGAVTYGHASVEVYGSKFTGRAAFQFYGAGDYDTLIEALGKWVRQAQKKTGKGDVSHGTT